MFTCRDVSERATAYLEGDVGLLDRLRMRAHLLVCENCRRFVTQVRGTADILRLSLRDRAGDLDLESALVEIRARRPAPPRPEQ